MFEYQGPTWTEVCSSIEYQEYSLLFDDVIAFQMAESDLVERRRLQAEHAAAMRAERLRTMPYREYLRTPEWHERASKTYVRFGGRCAFCNAPGDLEAHHRTYERRGHEEPGDLTALCPSCHSLFHEWRDLARQR
jgi:5-methylcytosine-specific restriction endonuclease McrA